MTNIEKNITAGLIGVSDFEQLELRTATEKWTKDKDRPTVEFQNLAELAFIKGSPLNDLPCGPSFTTAANSKAWISAAVLGGKTLTEIGEARGFKGVQASAAGKALINAAINGLRETWDRIKRRQRKEARQAITNIDRANARLERQKVRLAA